MRRMIEKYDYFNPTEDRRIRREIVRGIFRPDLVTEAIVKISIQRHCGINEDDRFIYISLIGESGVELEYPGYERVRMDRAETHWSADSGCITNREVIMWPHLPAECRPERACMIGLHRTLDGPGMPFYAIDFDAEIEPKFHLEIRPGNFVVSLA